MNLRYRLGAFLHPLLFLSFRKHSPRSLEAQRSKRRTETPTRHWRELLESSLWIGVVIAVRLVFPHAFLTPMLFSVLLVSLCAIAVRYQSLSAYCSAFLASGCYLLLIRFQLHEQRPYETLEAFLLLASTILVSELARAQRQRLVQIEKQYHQAEVKAGELVERQQAALAVNAELEKQIAGMPTSLAMLCDDISRLWNLHGNELYSAIVKLVANALSADSCTLYLGPAGQSYLAAQWPKRSLRKRAPLPEQEPVIARALREKQVYTIQEYLAEQAAEARDESQALVTNALIAGPLLNANGDVTGMIVIHAIPLLKFTPMGVRLFKALLPLLQNILQMQAQTTKQFEVKEAPKSYQDRVDVVISPDVKTGNRLWNDPIMPQSFSFDVSD
jgi:hypothetical protein